MRRKCKQIGAMFLAVMLAATNMSAPTPVKASAKTLKEQAATAFKEQDTNKEDYKEGEAVVMYYSSTTSKAKANESKLFGDNIKVEETYNFTSAQSSSLAKSRKSGQALLVSRVSSKTYSTESLVRKLKKQSNVQYAEPNYIYKATGTKNNGKYASYQWALENVGQNGGTPGCDINIASAWEQKTGTDKVIAIIDTGVDYTHEDLSANIWTNPYTSQLKGEHGYDFVNYDEDPIDDNGHGSHCAGIIAGSGTGVSGVNQTAKIMALKFLDEDGSGDLSGAVGAYDYINRAMNLGVDVVAVNNSWGGGEGSNILVKLIDMVGEKGAITVAAAGNDASDVDINDNEPWDFESDYVIKVAASNENDELANFSNYGQTTVDLAAPGADILSSVCTDTYNPSIHIGDADYSQMLDTFETAADIAKYKAVDCPEGSSISLSAGEGEGFGATKNDSMQMKINAQDEDYIYIAYQPITLPESKTSYHASAMVKAEANDDSMCMVFMGIDKISDIEKINQTQNANGILDLTDGEKDRNYWNMISVDTEKNSYSAKDGYAVWFAVIPMDKGEYTIQLDNIGFSKQDLESSALGKYSFYNGTSMAAPQVTGAVALISEIKGKMEPQELRDTVATCVRTSDKLKDKTINGGVLDLSKINKQSPLVKKITTNKDTVTIKGSFFGTDKGTVTLNGTAAEIKSWTKNEIVLAEAKNRNKKVTIEITTSNQNTVKRSAYLDYNETEITPLGEVNDFGTRLVGTDGTTLYSLTENGSIYGYNSQTGQWMGLGALSLTDLDKDGVLTETATFMYDSQLVYANNALYTIAEYDAGYYDVKAVVRYDIETARWSKVADLPAGFDTVEGSTLAAYKDKLYLLGGYDSKEEKVLTSVYSLDCKAETAAFTKEAATIPARFEAVAQNVGDKLVITLGGDGTRDENIEDDTYVAVPNAIVFDGKEWKEIKDSSFAATECNYYGIKEETGLPYYTAQTGLYKDGIIYTNLYTEELGNVFTYNVKENKYAALPCSLYSYTDESESMYGTTVADRFMFLTGEETYSYFDWDDWSKTKGFDFMEDIDVDYVYDYTLNCFDIETGFLQVAGDYTKLDGVGYYYPGSTVTITPVVGKGEYVVSLSVDGKEVKENPYTLTNITENHQVEAVTDKYITSITFDKSEYTAVVGQPLVLNAVVKKGESDSNTGSGSIDDWYDIMNDLTKGASYDDDYFNPDDWTIPDDWFLTDDPDVGTGSDNITWSVDNKKYATIEDGVLVGLKAGIGKSVTVTAEATDGSGIFAVVTVEIKENAVPATKLTLSKKTVSVKEGGSYRLKATLSPKEVSSKNLVWESSKSTVAMVSSTGEVIALKPGKVTITARTTDGSKLSAKCTVTVTPKDVKKVSAKQTTNSITLSWKKVDRASGYTVYRYDAKKKKDVAVYTTNSASKLSVKLSKLNGKTGKALTPGTEYTYKVAAFTKVGSTKIYGAKTTIKTATKPAASKVTNVKKNSSTKATVTWKKVSGVTGYEVYVSTSKKGEFKKATTVASPKTTSYTQSGLKKGNTYYYKVRTYKKVKGIKIYGDYSNVKEVKMK